MAVVFSSKLKSSGATAVFGDPWLNKGDVRFGVDVLATSFPSLLCITGASTRETSSAILSSQTRAKEQSNLRFWHLEQLGNLRSHRLFAFTHPEQDFLRVELWCTSMLLFDVQTFRSFDIGLMKESAPFQYPPDEESIKFRGKRRQKEDAVGYDSHEIPERGGSKPWSRLLRFVE